MPYFCHVSWDDHVIYLFCACWIYHILLVQIGGNDIQVFRCPKVSTENTYFSTCFWLFHFAFCDFQGSVSQQSDWTNTWFSRSTAITFISVSFPADRPAYCNTAQTPLFMFTFSCFVGICPATTSVVQYLIICYKDLR